MFHRRIAALVAVTAIAAAACSSAATPAPTTAPATAAPATTAASTAPSTGATAAAAGCTVGVSWNNYQEERWAKWDEPAIKASLAAAGATYISTDAKSSAATQT